MKSCSRAEIRRARPLLGTIVDVTCLGSPDDVDHAFAAIEKVHRLMSFHDPASDVSRMNAGAFRRSVIVDPWTWRVLQAAQEFSRESDGVFNITVASSLANWNYLPRLHGTVRHGNWGDIVLEENRTVRFRRRLIVDLGGIAKGFAVDRAVDVLQERSVPAGFVNAGGDVRAFGSTSQPIHLRHPSNPVRTAGEIRLRERSMATSAVYFAQRKYRGRRISPMLDGRTLRSSTELISVSVAAADCMTADALTKIVFALRENAAPLLTRFDADALLLERDGSPSWRFHSPCNTRDQTRFG